MAKGLKNMLLWKMQSKMNEMSNHGQIDPKFNLI